MSQLMRLNLAAMAWIAVGDPVMGGRSSSTLGRTAHAGVVFSGTVSAENNGGFASIRADVDRLNLSQYAGLVLVVKGDGHRYKLSLRHDTQADAVQYQAAFDTRGHEVESIWLPFGAFEARFRGKAVPDAPALALDRILGLGLLIADRQFGPFQIEWLALEAHEEAPQ